MIEVHNVWKSFNRPVLKGVSLTVNEDEIHAVVGPNGAGKTTLFRIVVGLLRPEKGKVRVLGKDPEEVKEKIGYLGEEPGFRKERRAWEELLSFCMLKFEDDKFCKEEVDRVLQLVGLDERREDKIGRLSQGMRQRLAIARSLLGDPKVLVWDEPFRGIDIFNKKKMIEFIKNNLKGKSILISTHTMEDVEKLANRITILVNGEVKASSSVDELSLPSYRGVVVLKDGEVTKCKVIRKVSNRFEVVCDESQLQELLREVAGRALKVCIGPSIEDYVERVVE